MTQISGQNLRRITVFIGDADHDIFLFRLFHLLAYTVFACVAYVNTLF